MINKQKISELIASMSSNYARNLYFIKAFFGRANYRDDDNQTILHILVDNKYDEAKCLIAIRTLLAAHLSPNDQDDFKYNFIQTALYAGYSENFIINIIKESLKYGLDVNHIDDDEDTIMHTAIYSDDYHGEVINIYKLLIATGFVSAKVDHDGRNIVDAMIYMSTTKQKSYTQTQIDEIKELYQSQVKNNQPIHSNIQDNHPTTNDQVIYNNTAIQPTTNKQSSIQPTITLSTEIIKELEKYGQILNLKEYSTAPTIGRDNELKDLLITLAADKKSPILVGESGVGKSALVDELAYRIQTGNVPKFLANQIILEVSPADLVSGCRYVGDFEKKMTDLLSLCQKHQIMLFIDEIHTIYGIGTSEKKDMDLAAVIKHYLDRSNLKIIGTTTDEEYTKYFAYDALKRRFEKIVINEPTEEILAKIIEKVFDDYANKNHLFVKDNSLKDIIISIITTATTKNHRIYNDNVNNPDLAISIIDKAFAYAKYYDSETLTIEHFIDSFNSCYRLSGPAKEQAITTLKEANPTKSNPLTRILKFEKPKH